MFGEFIKQKRIELGYSLRIFCKLLNEDPSNWSKIERKILLPPKDKKKLNKIAEILKIKHGSKESDQLYDYANIDSAKIPDYIVADNNIMDSLPAFFRTVGSVKPTKKEIEKLIKILKSGKKKHE